MRRGSIIIILIFMLAAFLDYVTYQDDSSQEKFLKSYYENGKIKTEKYVSKGIELKILNSPEINNFHKIRLRNNADYLVESYTLSSQSYKNKFQAWDQLTSGTYHLELLDNFGELYVTPIYIKNSKTLSYSEMMDLFYPKFRSIISNDFNPSDILKINVTQNGTQYKGFNAKLYRDSTNILMLDLVYKNMENEKLKSIVTFKCKEELINNLISLERTLAFNTKDVKRSYPHSIIEIIVNTRQVYKIPIDNDKPISQQLIETIYKSSEENSSREIRLY